ncbi:MAG: rod-binding protein [Gammaproteobacteria bacterium]
MTWRFDGGTSSSMQGAQFYADQAALKGLSHSTNQAEGVEKAAREFEGLFINLVFKSMREANAVFETDSVFNSRETNFYRDMLDSQLSAELARGGGIGLAQIMMRQMMPPDSVGLEAQSAQSAYHVTEPGITLDRARMVPGKASERASSETPGDTNATGSVFPNADTQALYGDAESLLSMRHQSDSAPVKTVQADPVDLSEPIDSPERFIEAVWSQAESAARQLNVDPGVPSAERACRFSRL